MVSNNTEQWIRKCGLIVSVGTKGLDLSNMRIKFQTFAPESETAPTAIIRIFNLSDTTAKLVQKEFQVVTLQAGYEHGNYGVIFQGTIKQFRRGKENATETFLDLMCSDGDFLSNFVVMNGTREAGSDEKTRAEDIFKAVQTQSDATFQAGQTMTDPRGIIPLELKSGGTRVLPRGKVSFGLAREQMNILTRTNGMTWNIQNGKINIKPLTGYLPGEAVKLTAKTGLIGIPEATTNGVEVTTLINPRYQVGGRVQIDNASINTLIVREQAGFPRQNSFTAPATVTEDGFYRILVIENRGDTRGNEWYSSLTCLAVDPSAPPDNSVKAAG